MRIVRALLLVLTLSAAVVLVGLIPVNNGFQTDPNGIEIYLVSTSVHADVVLPVKTDYIDWRESFPAESFTGDTSQATHVTIGWGDRRFCMETPDWDDMRVSTASRALLWPTDSCMHVYMTTAESIPATAKSLRISAAQYERLVEHIGAGFQHDTDQKKIQIDHAPYGFNDAFFEAHGTYHLLNNCNCWVGRVMQSAEIRTAWFTPLPKTMFLYLRD